MNLKLEYLGTILLRLIKKKCTVEIQALPLPSIIIKNVHMAPLEVISHSLGSYGYKYHQKNT